MLFVSVYMSTCMQELLKAKGLASAMLIQKPVELLHLY